MTQSQTRHTNQQITLRRIIMLSILLAGMAGLVSGYSFLQSNQPQLLGLALLTLLTIPLFLYALRQVYRNETRIAAVITLGAITTCMSLSNLFITDLALVIVLTSLLLTALVVGTVFQGRAILLALAALSVPVFAAFLIDALANVLQIERIGLEEVSVLTGFVPIVFVMVGLTILLQLITTYRRSESIRNRLMIAFILVALLPIAIITTSLLALSWTVGQQQVYEQLESVAALQTYQINSWQRTLETDLLTLARQEEIAIMQSLGLGTSSASNIRRTQSDLRTNLRRVVDEIQRFTDFYLIDPTGLVVVSSNRVMQNAMLNDEAFFEPALAGPHIEPPYHSEQLGDGTLIFSQPILDRDNNLVAVLAGQVSIQLLDTIMQERAGLGETGETYLVSPTYHMLTNSRFEDPDAAADERQGDHEHEIRTDGTEAAIQQQASGRSTYLGYYGEPVIGVYTWLPDLGIALMAEQSEAEALADLQGLILISGLIAIGALVFALATALVVTSGISRPISLLVQTARQISDGDLDTRAPVLRQDEIGQLATTFNTMTDNLSERINIERANKEALEHTVADYTIFIQRISDGDLTDQLQISSNGSSDNEDLYQLGDRLNGMVARLSDMTSQIRSAAQQVSTVATQIQAATAQQMSGASEQDAAVTQTAATVEEVRRTVQQTADRAQSVADSSQQALVASASGQQAVNDTIEGMQLIRDRVQSIAETILMLSERTQQIGEIINTVNALADQSKLLALNASIEAARAGEEGRGFAVVAMEVRQLAEQSRDATARVSTILNEIQQATNTAVMVTEEGSKGTDAGLELVHRTGTILQQLAATVEQNSQAAVQIATSTQQQTNGMEQLSAAMEQIRVATRQAADSTRQTEASVRELAAMAQQLENAVTLYKLESSTFIER